MREREREGSDLHIGEVGPFGNFVRVLRHYHVVCLVGIL